MMALLKPLPPRAPGETGAAFAVTLGLVAAAVLVRLLLQPVFGGDHAYTAFYPAVILTSYLAGRRAGLVATGLSAGLAYWVFVEPTLAFKLTAGAFTPLVFFAANASVAVYLVSGLTSALEKIAGEQGRAEAAARQNAELFRELNERVTHHLQLVSGVLALQSQREPEDRVARALAKASETSLLLSRAHRDIAGRTVQVVDFTPFARQLIRAKLISQGSPADAIEIAGENFELPPDQATSLGVALLECLTVLLNRGEPARLKLQFSQVRGQVALRVAQLDAPTRATLALLADTDLLRAVVEQLGARLSIGMDEEGGAVEILFPRSADRSATLARPTTIH